MILFHNELREAVSFLMSEGHPAARHYTIGHLWTETAIARRRVNNHMATESTLMQALLGATLNGKSGAGHYKNLIKRLTDG